MKHRVMPAIKSAALLLLSCWLQDQHLDTVSNSTSTVASREFDATDRNPGFLVALAAAAVIAAHVGAITAVVDAIATATACRVDIEAAPLRPHV